MITMCDSVNPAAIPGNPEAVAGYVDGRFKNYAQMVARFPKAHHISIAVSATSDADTLDIETGDAVIADAIPWVRRQHARGVERPILYIESSRLPELLATMNRSIPRDQYMVWSAHYTGVPHVEPGCQATQYEEDKAADVDRSLCYEALFGIVPKPDMWQPGDEHNWCVEWDRIKARKTPAAHLRRLYLRGRMLARRRQITNAAKRTGWKAENRLYRYKQLQERSG